MDKVWLVQIAQTDDATYCNYVTVAVCTDEVEVIKAEEELLKTYDKESIHIEEVVTNKVLV